MSERSVNQVRLTLDAHEASLVPMLVLEADVLHTAPARSLHFTRSPQAVDFLVHGQVTIIFEVSVCLFVQSFSQPSLIRFRSNLDICYMSGSSCVP